MAYIQDDRQAAVRMVQDYMALPAAERREAARRASPRRARKAVARAS
jgi:hypothetical protein